MAVGVIVFILFWEGNILDVRVNDITLDTEEAAIEARERLERGESVADIADSYGDAVDSFNEDRMMPRNQAQRISNEVTELLFTRTDLGTVIGPYESRDGWYVAEISDQTVIGLGTVYDVIDERILSEVPSRARAVDFWLPVLLCSCGLLLTFSAGLWNIGIEGQVGMGALGATSIAIFAGEQPLAGLTHEQLIVVELFMAAAAGGLWALVTAIMRTRGGVNEIFGGVAMNFIASNFSAYLLVGPWAPPNSSGSATARFSNRAILTSMDKYDLSMTTIIITAVCFLFVLITLSGARWGLQLRAMGKNERSAQMLGVPTERNIWLAMTLCGMMAGLAGGHLVLFTRKNLPANVSGGIGFLALLVVLLASIRVLWVPLISLAFSVLFTSGLPLRTRLQLDQSLVGVFVGLLVFFVFIFSGVRQRLEEILGTGKVTPVDSSPQEATDGSSSG